MTAGPALFARYAAPPNLLGYCGPSDLELLQQLLAEPDPPVDELTHAARQFVGAFPYLELIGGSIGSDPLARRVVEAYWTGNGLLDGIDPLRWGNSLDERFRRRAGRGWDAVARSLPSGGVPNHAFHVFCVYPWVGLLRSEAADPALSILDRCRISWGEVVGVSGSNVEVRSRHLVWGAGRLELGTPELTPARRGPDPVAAGDVVSLHWDSVCERLTPRRAAALRSVHDRHLRIANAGLATAP
jgi:Family of unknown function (DUF6390)